VCCTEKQKERILWGEKEEKRRQGSSKASGGKKTNPEPEEASK